MDAAPICRMVPAAFLELQREHGLLLRYLGQVQQRLSTQLHRLETENLRLRAALVVQRTAWLWGLVPSRTADVPQSKGPRTEDAGTSQAPVSVSQVLCRVACEGHAHYWLGEDGRCQRSGEPCAP